MSVLLDTHVWVWWLTPSSPLPDADREALDRQAAKGGVCLSAISLWEAQVLHAKRRLELPVPFGVWLREAANEAVLKVLPLDLEVVLALDALPASFHGDPADRLIVATARAHGLPLATHDALIRRSRAAPVWKP